MNTRTLCFFGFADQKSEMQKSNIYARLSSVRRRGQSYSGVNYNGKQYSYTEYIRQLVKEAVEFRIVDHDGKKEYRIMFPNHMMVTLNKTQYDFAVYLKENGYEDDAKADAYYAQYSKESAEKYEREKAEEQAAAERRVQYNIRKHEFESSLDQWIAETEQSHPYAVSIAQKKSEDLGYPYNHRLMRVLALMCHSEMLNESDVAQEMFNKAIRESLYVGNKVSRKLFELYSGFKLPSTEKGTTEALEQWLQSPVVLTDEALLAIPKQKRTRRSSDTVAIMDILEENSESPKLKCALLKGREVTEHGITGNEYMLFNSTRIYILYHPDPSIPVYEDEVMCKAGYNLVDANCANLFDCIDREWTLKTIKTFMKEYPDSNFKIVEDYSLAWINPLFLKEALIILGEESVFYRYKHFIVAKSERGMALMCMNHSPKR